MTKAQFREKFADLLQQTNNRITERAEHLLASGAISLSDYEDDYLLPKIILTACLEDAVFQWRPYNPKYRAEVKNLSHF